MHVGTHRHTNLSSHISIELEIKKDTPMAYGCIYKLFSAPDGIIVKEKFLVKRSRQNFSKILVF
jgi:hypothetical protein